ncbi:hypothetical protein AMECASPLE_039521 [Ameca splendens]|uniref:Uncharacterized protein n=1 Tax=Ameca splendens TaxID=208324 RepID=A0ABV0ZH88_9TELE
MFSSPICFFIPQNVKIKVVSSAIRFPPKVIYDFYLRALALHCPMVRTSPYLDPSSSRSTLLSCVQCRPIGFASDWPMSAVPLHNQSHTDVVLGLIEMLLQCSPDNGVVS